MIQDLKGLGVAMVTPFNEKREIDFQGLKRLIDFLVHAKVDYLVVNGTTGESVTLSNEEVNEVLQFVIKNSGDVPVWVGCGGNDTLKIAKKMAKFEADFKIKGFLSVSPYYNKPTQKGILAHYQYLSRSTSKPIILYNIPGRTASEISIETILQLSEIENIVGVKDAVNDINKSMLLASRMHKDFALLAGDDAMALPMLACGYHGVISVIGNIKPIEFKQMIHWALNQELEKARKLHYEMLPLMGALFKEGNPVGVKACLEILNICRKYVRLPLVEASEDLFLELKNLLSLHKVSSS
ncbi:MAG: 4-hydroxy-tetrahydrodipicolinate synthase [Bacteroidia bacterium]|nr:MAG: 4-hydroxy-tetrahydrodipicolinate synthase [Bacteroidia bacterium]